MSSQKSYGLAIKLGVDFVSAVLVGVIIGYWCDRFFTTSPIFLIIFIVLGAIAGFRNVYKYATNVMESDKTKGDDHA